MDALNRGNNAQASQLWLTMSAADRANFSHGVGFKPQMDRDDVASALLKHEQEEAAKDAQDSITDPDNDSDTASDSGAETESQQIEMPGVEGDAADGLANLPAHLPINVPVMNTPNQAPPITEIGPQ